MDDGGFTSALWNSTVRNIESRCRRFKKSYSERSPNDVRSDARGSIGTLCCFLPATLAVLERGGDADLDAELVRPMGLALADAFDFQRMQGIDLPAALMLFLLAHAPRQQ